MKARHGFAPLFLSGYGLVCLVAAVGQLFAPGWVADRFGFARADGWQRELAIFDFLIFVMCAWGLRQMTAEKTRMVGTALVWISGLLAISHGISYLETGASWHAGWGVLCLGSVVGAWRVRATRISFDLDRKST